jgi:hypothetical protein
LEGSYQAAAVIMAAVRVNSGVSHADTLIHINVSAQQMLLSCTFVAVILDLEEEDTSDLVISVPK